MPRTRSEKSYNKAATDKEAEIAKKLREESKKEIEKIRKATQKFLSKIKTKGGRKTRRHTRT